MEWLRHGWLVMICVLGVSCSSSIDVETIEQNKPVIRAINKMPSGGGYSTMAVAHNALARSIQVSEGGLDLSPKVARPSYCSGATYLVLLGMVEEALEGGQLQLSAAELEALRMRGEADGVGMWGRWNANGPGAAKVLKDLGMGVNFESYADARPGDFMKIFWTDEIGRNEFGHLVVYLGTSERGGEEYVTFWSSNQARGYGVKSVPKSSIKWAIFSRVTHVAGVKGVDTLEREDRYLSSMLMRSYTRDNVRSRCRVRRSLK
ncbi:hypothetical protein [Rubritalea tangerina]|uniref:Peptidase C39-like domain-containing protein n=1 Tax=Rubritalea tangerina TaxID=430798 RepID=A0ABW4ZD60_9BACT